MGKFRHEIDFLVPSTHHDSVKARVEILEVKQLHHRTNQIETMVFLLNARFKEFKPECHHISREEDPLVEHCHSFRFAFPNNVNVLLPLLAVYKIRDLIILISFPAFIHIVYMNVKFHELAVPITMGKSL
ncbi:hypothetical protein Ahy_B05g077732 isoform B [Arachis hypogaea]|uniref:Uncharacterized protein n=1 Tax=Arachis hypogaea TaxID=3818 RepID=A0A444Z5D5_ARAHY|nr:hypothetical protein Ahy_B05g077732 isoform B [Arachis hypogaea]